MGTNDAKYCNWGSAPYNESYYGCAAGRGVGGDYPADYAAMIAMCVEGPRADWEWYLVGKLNTMCVRPWRRLRSG